MKFKILLVSPYLKDANSFWRSVGPMNYLAKHSGGDIEVVLAPEKEPIAWDTVSQFDLVFLHRPCRPDDLTVLQIARNLNIPVWSDFDDWLFQLPSWNPNGATYNLHGIQTIMAHIICASDILSVSTSALYDRFKLVNPNTVIIPNAYRSDLYPYRQEETPERLPIFMWRGSNTHDGDMTSVLGAWENLNGKVHFLGSPAWMAIQNMDKSKYQILSHQDFMLFFKYIYQLAPKVVLFPLSDCFFNRCKSNIAYIEAIHAGALCVAPDLPEWQRPGVITYTPGNAVSFQMAANQAMEMPHLIHREQVRIAFKEMKELYDITVINQIRIELIKTIMNNNYEKNKRDPFDQLTAIWAYSKLTNVPMVKVSPETLQKKNLA